MPEQVFRYFGTDNPVKLGDRILVHRLLRRSLVATVVYIPGQSELDAEVGDDQWLLKYDDGSIYATEYCPAEWPHPGKNIEFVTRPGAEAQEVINAYRIPLEESTGEPGRDILALIGCGTLILIIFLICGVVWMLIVGR